jgi:PIN domain nuclease of toxin-antitoxin system
MAALLLDTHAWVWSFAATALLSAAARAALDDADAVYVSPVSFFEIGQKVRLGKWPEMSPHAARLVDILREQGGLTAPCTPEICLRAGTRDWAHRDPFDRLLAATAECMAIPLVTRDTVYDDLPGVRRIW